MDINITKSEQILIKQILSPVLSKYQILAFGSRANKMNKEFSDLDLCLKTKDDSEYSFGLLEELRSHFEASDLTFIVDVVIYSELSQEFKKVIDNNSVELFKE